MDNNENMLDLVKAVTFRLWAYCEENDWAGYDPYDALNSKIFKSLPFLNFRIPRLVFTQALKRMPFNMRPLLLIPKTQNPKAIALFIMASLKLKKVGSLENDEFISVMTKTLKDLRSQNIPYWCWGYSFPWQTRTILVPRGAPNLVCTVFVANALLDAYEANLDPQYLSMAYSSAEYILNKLYWEQGNTAAGLSYPQPFIKTRVHNANFLGAALLCRVHRLSGEQKFLEPALRLARYSTGKQHRNGSWNYGESVSQRWADNFHTGYNLCALRLLGKYAETKEFEFHIRRGFEFYRKHFFREDGAPRYFHDRTYPIDIHCVAQSIITLLTLKDLDENNVSQAYKVFSWAIKKMWDDKKFFYYRDLSDVRNKISYMRWSQAWMLLALSTLLEEFY